MQSLEEVLGSSDRNFLIIAHRARSDGSININDLCGASGRWDGVARAITSALFLSHDMRRDTSVHILLLGPEDPPKLLSINGESVKYLNPDERACAALMRKCLSHELADIKGSVVRPSPGITIARADLDMVLGRFPGKVYMMDEMGSEMDGSVIAQFQGSPLMFVLSDDQDLTMDESTVVTEKAYSSFRVGEKVLHSHMVISIIHFLLDRYSR
ncbi:MAG: tRNA (pseudouridine(54)-N(1))-methyltransferase TrmY [Thermoplasmatota archaeon]